MNLGSYSKISEVWVKYPEGGREGDTVVIGAMTFKWDKYSQNWVSGEGGVVTSGYDVGGVSGDLHVSRHQVIGGDETVRGSSLVKRDLRVEGTLYARIKGADKGLFPSMERLNSIYPKAVEGDYAVIGEKIPGSIYRYDGKSWVDTGEVGGNGGNIDLEDYYNKEVVDVRTNEINISRLYPAGGIGGTDKYTLRMAITGVPTKLQSVGVKCSFLNSAGKVETWEYQGGEFINVSSWLQIGAGKISELGSRYQYLPTILQRGFGIGADGMEYQSANFGNVAISVQPNTFILATLPFQQVDGLFSVAYYGNDGFIRSEQLERGSVHDEYKTLPLYRKIWLMRKSPWIPSASWLTKYHAATVHIEG